MVMVKTTIRNKDGSHSVINTPIPAPESCAMMERDPEIMEITFTMTDGTMLTYSRVYVGHTCTNDCNIPCDHFV